MKTIARRILFVLTLVAYAFLMALVLGAARSGRHLATCNKLEVNLLDEHSTISAEDVQLWLEQGYGTWIGQSVDSLDISRMERVLNSRSAIKRSEVWATGNGVLHVSVAQREPAVRFHTADNGFYVDAQGYIFPLQARHTFAVPVIDGNVPLKVPAGYKGAAASEEEREWIASVLKLLDYMKRSKYWDEAIVQISVNGQGDLVMIPREGRERFIFGGPDNPAEKFERMERYYRYILPEKGPDYYKTVNVKYKGQVICRK